MLTPVLETQLGLFQKFRLLQGDSFKSISFYDQTLYAFFGCFPQALMPEEVHASEVMVYAKRQLAAGRSPLWIQQSFYHLAKFFDWYGLRFPGRGIKVKAVAAGWEPEGLPPADVKWDS